MRLIVNFSNAFRTRFLKSKQVAPYLNQGLSYTDAMRTARGKPLGINTTSPIINTLQSRSYMTDPMDLSYVHSNLSKMNREAPVIAGESSTLLNRLDNNNSIAATTLDAKKNWVTQRGLRASEVGIAPEGSAMDLTSQIMVQPERPANRLAVGGITSHTHPMMDSHVPSLMDIGNIPNQRLARNMPMSDIKQLYSQQIPYTMETMGKYDPYYATKAPIDNFIYHQKSPTRSAVVHYPESDNLYNDTGLALKKSSDRNVQNTTINKTIDKYTNTAIHDLDDSSLRNLGMAKNALGNVPSDVKLKDIGYEPEQFTLSNLGKDSVLLNSYMAHPEIQNAYANVPKLIDASINLNSGIKPTLEQLKTKPYKSEQVNVIRGSYKAAKDLGLQYTQLGTVNKLTGKKR